MTASVAASVDLASQRPSLWAPSAPPFGSTWADFIGWTAWLDTAYELQLPRCWTLHEGLVHSLTALWHPWRSVYAAPIASGGAPPAHGGPSQWHTSHLYPLRDRLQRPDGAPGSACRNRDHRAYSPVWVGEMFLENGGNSPRSLGSGRPRDSRGDGSVTTVASCYLDPP